MCQHTILLRDCRDCFEFPESYELSNSRALWQNFPGEGNSHMKRTGSSSKVLKRSPEVPRRCFVGVA